MSACNHHWTITVCTRVCVWSLAVCTCVCGADDSSFPELALMHSLNKCDLILCPHAARSGEWEDPPCTPPSHHRQ